MGRPSLSRLFATLAVAAITLLTPGSRQVAHAASLEVNPPKLELFGNPGDTLFEKIKVRNDDEAPATYSMGVEDFTASDEEGGVAFVEDPNAPRTSYSLASWITVDPPRFVVPGGGEKVINVTIKIPKDGEPGSHFASVQVSLAPATPVAGSASVESKLNSLILLRVSGNITEKVTLDSFKASDSYFQHGPIDFVLRAKNEGNVHLVPTGTITVKDGFNRKVKEIPLRGATILPGTARISKTTWEDKNMIGRYTATLVATYGENKQPLAASASFIVLPVSLLVLLGAVILAILLAISQRKKFRKVLHRLTAD